MRGKKIVTLHSFFNKAAYSQTLNLLNSLLLTTSLMNNIGVNIELGFKRNIKAFFIHSFLCFSVLWTIIEASSSLLFQEDLVVFSKQFIFYFFLGLVSLIYGVIAIYPKNETSVKIGSRNTKVIIKFGDLFEEEGITVIPASQFFESEVEEFISPKSIQAQFINKYYDGHRSQYKKDIISSLSNSVFTEKDRGMGPERKYILGECPILKIGTKKFIHVAITETEIKKFEPPLNATTVSLVTALQSLWKNIIAESNGERVVIPLLGSGITGIALTPQKILELNLILIQEALLNNHTIPEVVILLHRQSVFAEIDLSKLS